MIDETKIQEIMIDEVFTISDQLLLIDKVIVNNEKRELKIVLFFSEKYKVNTDMYYYSNLDKLKANYGLVPYDLLINGELCRMNRASSTEVKDDLTSSMLSQKIKSTLENSNCIQKQEITYSLEKDLYIEELYIAGQNTEVVEINQSVIVNELNKYIDKKVTLPYRGKNEKGYKELIIRKLKAIKLEDFIKENFEHMDSVKYKDLNYLSLIVEMDNPKNHLIPAVAWSNLEPKGLGLIFGLEDKPLNKNNSIIRVDLGTMKADKNSLELTLAYLVLEKEEFLVRVI